MFCDFVLTDRADGFYDAHCTRCDRTVRVRSRNAKAACRASPDYARVHAGMIVKFGQFGGREAPATGPGAELARLLSRLGIHPSQNCLCRSMASRMNAWGPDECERPERIEEVLAVMRNEARRRGLPFVDAVGRLLIKKAIRNARKRLPTPCV